MNRDQKAAFIEDVAGRVTDCDAIFAVDYRGINVPQVAQLRDNLREVDASFQIVKNTLTRRALDQTGNEGLKEFLVGPTAFTYVKGDAALAAKALSNFAKENEILTFKGGEISGQILSVEQFNALASLPALNVLHGRLVGMVAAPLTGLVRTLNALISGLAIQLEQIREQGLVTGEAPAVAAPAEVVAEPVAEEPAAAEEAPAEEAATEEPAAEEPAAEEAVSEDAPAEEPEAEAAPAEEAAEEPEAAGEDE